MKVSSPSTGKKIKLLFDNSRWKDKLEGEGERAVDRVKGSVTPLKEESNGGRKLCKVARYGSSREQSLRPSSA